MRRREVGNESRIRKECELGGREKVGKRGEVNKYEKRKDRCE
jgi:hypothetical protein